MMFPELDFTEVNEFHFDPRLVYGWHFTEAVGFDGDENPEPVRICTVYYHCFQIQREDNDGKLEEFLRENCSKQKASREKIFS